MKKKILAGALVALFLLPINVFAAKGDQGVDWAIYQGDQGRFGYAHDKFAIAQIGGYNANGIYEQRTYKTQVASAIAQGKRAHTYIWYDTYGNMDIAKQTMDYFLPKIQTPKGSIVALDFEHGASSDRNANTETILYGMRRIRQAGYTPMYYSYKPFTLKYVDYKRIIKEFPNSLWIAGYPSYNVTPEPLYNYFPSMDGVAIWQFTSTYIAGGLDGNVDLTGITDNGYTNSDKPQTDTPAIIAGEETSETPKSQIKVGDTVKVNFSANQWATGEAIPQWVKGESYKVQQVDGNKILLANILSWIDKSNVDVLKVEVPVNMHYVEGYSQTDFVHTKEEAAKFFQEQAAATHLPYIFLSAGVEAELFYETLRFAKAAGSTFNGVLCGRATWSAGVETFVKHGKEAAMTWMNEEGSKKIQQLNQVLKETATPVAL
ncbi:GH25 family lysozyme [Enterococcus hirae]|uniref:GH25 family lysozyme n=1 Tax=Enterococcus hirae TaxID=1354 RepID=UPI003F1F4D68